METTVKDFAFLSIDWDPNTQAVIMKWKSFAHGDDFRAGLNAGLDLIKEKKSHKWLADLRDLGTVPTKDQEWSNNDWYPRAIAGGIRKMAIIMPKSTLSSMSVKNILTKVQGVDIETNYFDNIDAAKEWLKS